jgi:hypothetical protein
MAMTRDASGIIAGVEANKKWKKYEEAPKGTEERGLRSPQMIVTDITVRVNGRSCLNRI